MMVVTALSLPEMIMLRKVLKIKFLAVFAGIMIITIVAVGYLFNSIMQIGVLTGEDLEQIRKEDLS